MNARHLRSIHDASLDNDSVVTIGVFDGVHRGHQALMKQLARRARQTNRKAVAVTFFPHPDKVLRRAEQRYYLTHPDQRARLLLDLGIDLVITHPFDEATRSLRAAEFVRLLVRHLNMRELRVGAEFALGYQREGDIAFLREQGEEHDFRVEIVAPVTDGGERIRSAALRQLARDGDVHAASALLGRAYSLAGEVILGQRRGRTIGVPTANLAAWSEQIVPANGVYATWARVDGLRRMAATNIGVRPTFAGEDLSIESHLLDFSGDIYGKRLRLEFIERIRPERRFAGVDALVAQISADIDAVRRVLAGELD